MFSRILSAKGTKAEAFDNQVSPNEKERRAHIMGELVRKSREKFLSSQVGLTEEVLIERYRHGYLEGYTKNYTPVHIYNDDTNLCSLIKSVKITKAADDFCIGELV